VPQNLSQALHRLPISPPIIRQRSPQQIRCYFFCLHASAFFIFLSVLASSPPMNHFVPIKVHRLPARHAHINPWKMGRGAVLPKHVATHVAPTVLPHTFYRARASTERKVRLHVENPILKRLHDVSTNGSTHFPRVRTSDDPLTRTHFGYDIFREGFRSEENLVAQVGIKWVDALFEIVLGVVIELGSLSSFCGTTVSAIATVCSRDSVFVLLDREAFARSCGMRSRRYTGLITSNGKRGRRCRDVRIRVRLGLRTWRWWWQSIGALASFGTFRQVLSSHLSLCTMSALYGWGWLFFSFRHLLGSMLGGTRGRTSDWIVVRMRKQARNRRVYVVVEAYGGVGKRGDSHARIRIRASILHSHRLLRRMQARGASIVKG